MADKNRHYSMVVVYRPDGQPKSWCIAETEGQARDIARIYRKSYTERDGFRLVNYPIASRQKAMAFRPPPLTTDQNTPAACKGEPPSDFATAPDDDAVDAETGRSTTDAPDRIETPDA